MSNNDQINWVAVRHAYGDGKHTIASICRQQGLTRGQLEYRRKKDGWPSRHPAPQSGGHKTNVSPPNRIKRLYRLLDRLMKEIEMQSSNQISKDNAADVSTADRERSARTLSSLIRSFEKIKELETEELSVKQAKSDDQLNEAEEKKVKELCEILEERFAKLSNAEEVS